MANPSLKAKIEAAKSALEEGQKNTPLNQERDDRCRTLMTLWAEKCLKDAVDGKGDTGRRLQEKSEQRDPYYNKDRIFRYSRIDL